MFIHSRLLRCAILTLGIAAAFVSLAHGPAMAADAWTYSDTHPAINPQPWACGGLDPGAQLLKHEHRNWHCTWTGANTPAWGNAFVGFHRQLITDYEIWRLGLGGDRVEIWDYGPGAIIPGDDETTSTPYTHCPEFPGSSRPAGAVCGGCASLPNSLHVLNIGAFPTLGHAGAQLNSSGWHGSFHVNAGVTGGACNEVGSTATATRDPIFWMGHKKVDDVARTWQRQKAADIVVVIDRSGSMNDDCNNTTDCSGPNPPADTGCRLNAAKNAALLLADLLDDTGVDGNQHRIGLVSFSSTATQNLGFTNASGIVTDNGADDTPYEAAVAGLQACGTTAIGEGIQSAINMLNATGTNPHQAILVLTDGRQNTGLDIGAVAGNLGLIQVCAIGIGTGGNESDLRDVAESHGGIFIAQQSLDSTALTLEKFFVDCFAQIFDEVINEDPHFQTFGGHISYGPIHTEVLPQTSKLMFASGFRPPVNQQPGPLCRWQWQVTSPNGDLVRIGDPLVETGQGPQWAFQRVRLPYMNQQQGQWTARLVRPQRIFFHGFPTDAYGDPAEGVRLVREEIHRLIPGGADRVLYYEDGNLTGFSSYQEALDREVFAGLIQEVKQANSADEFLDLLQQDWELIVFARQVDATPQVYDSRLAAVLCSERKGLVTDLFSPAGAVNALYSCVGLGAEPSQYDRLVGDGQLIVDPMEIVQRPYQAPYLYLFPDASNEPLIALGFAPQGQPTVVGTGSFCGPQEGFYTTHTAGVGLVEPANIRPRVLLGQRILATFEMTELNRPVGGWDAVGASVELVAPSGQVTKMVYPLYDDGTNGDKAIGNNTWSNLIPDATTQPGPHRLRGIFDLTLGNQTVRREAEYSVIVEREPEPELCTKLACYEEVNVARGWELKLGPCIGNMCLEETTYSVVVDADKPWLCVDDGSGVLVPVGAGYQFTTPPVMPGQPTCFFDDGPLYLCVPADAQDGETVIVDVSVTSSQNPNLPNTCRTVNTVKGHGLSAVDDLPEPAGFALLDAWPNPFNPRTEIGFTLPGQPGATHLTSLLVFDARGNLVRTLVDGRLAAGAHRVTWDGRDESGQTAPAGVYLYRLTAAGQVGNGKVVMLK